MSFPAVTLNAIRGSLLVHQSTTGDQLQRSQKKTEGVIQFIYIYSIENWFTHVYDIYI